MGLTDREGREPVNPYAPPAPEPVTSSATPPAPVPTDGSMAVTVHVLDEDVAAFLLYHHARRNRVQLSLLDRPLRPDQLLDLVPADIRIARTRRAAEEHDRPAG